MADHNNPDIESFGEYDIIFTQPPSDFECPSEKYGNKLAGPVFVGVIVLACVVVLIIVKCAKMNQEAKAAKSRAQENRVSNEAKHYLTCQTWPPEAIETTGDETGESTETTNGSSDLQLEPGRFALGKSHRIAALPQPKSFQDQDIDGKHECMLCEKPFDGGDLVYESNNTHCHHQFHKKCIEKWLEIQNTCSICNNPFVIMSVTLGVTEEASFCICLSWQVQRKTVQQGIWWRE